MNYAQRITTALDKESEIVSVLGHLPLTKLNNKMLLLKKQMASADKFEQYEAIELLKIWEDQIINAKVLKQELSIEDNDTLDVDMEIAELAAFEMIEKRQDLLKSKLLKEEFTINGKK